MFTNFLKVTLRNLCREKMYAVINIAGLSIAIACCIILSLYLKSELTYDRHNTKYKQIFRVATETNMNSKKDHITWTQSIATTSPALGPMLSEDYPEVKGFVRFRYYFYKDTLFRHGDKAFYWKNICAADANVFDVFTHNIIYGDPKTALVDPSSIAVSETFAKKYFGNANPIGETISDDTHTHTYKITLVFADLPENSHMKYDALLFYVQWDRFIQDSYKLFTVSDFTYLVMPDNYDIREFQKISDSFFKKHMAETANSMKSNPEDIFIYRFWLQPLADIHLKSDVGDDLPTGNRFYVYGFAAVALFILFVACINYINLATSRATRREKEVGMRKILGADRMHLILHFMGESIFFSMIALFFGLVLVEITLNLTPINDLLGKALTLNFSHEPVLLGCLLIFSLAIGVMSGVYPAIYLSSMLPLSVLARDNRSGKQRVHIRELLILIQFIISVGVIACALLMTLQMRYISHKPLGFDKLNRLIITLRGTDLINKISIIKKDLSKKSSILGISASDTNINDSHLSQHKIENNNGVMEYYNCAVMEVGDEFLETMGMQLTAGRNLSNKLITDSSSSFIVNETLVKMMGWKDPLGKRIQVTSYEPIGHIIGVVKDFHLLSLHNPVEPIILRSSNLTQNQPDDLPQIMWQFLFLHISDEDTAGTLAFLKKKFEEIDPKHPFQYEFLDDSLDNLYLSEKRVMALILIFAGVCILISCMGLFGLSSFTTERRTKEIGIRKVVGATTWQIITMLSQRILLLVLGGAAIASLIAYYAMDEWLSGFAYRKGINPLVFLVSAGIAAGVAFITVTLQSYKTARANPIEALRYE